MRDNQTERQDKAPCALIVAVIAAVLLVGGLLTWWTVRKTDLDMREALLQQARLAANAVNTDYVRTLAGSESDLDTPDYQRIKAQLISMKTVSTRCRFVYLMGRRPDGEVFYFVDSEPLNSEDYSPPGQIFAEASDALRRGLVTGEETVEGPVTDRWGTWVSALVPLIPPGTTDAIAVLGMDVDASAWRRAVLASASGPIGLTLAIGVLLVSVLLLAESRRRVLANRESLRQSRDLLDETQHLAGIGGWEWDALRQTMTWTRETYRLHGFEPDTIPPGSPEHIERSLECYDPDDRPVIRAAFRRCAEKGDPYCLEFPLTTAQGKRCWIQTMARAVWEGDRVVKVLGNMVDITERKRSEDALRESYAKNLREREFSQLLLDTSPAFIVAIGFDGKTVMMNPAMLETVEYTMDEVRDTDYLTTFVPEEDREALIPVFRKIIDERKPTLNENRIVSKSGKTYLVEWHGRTVNRESPHPDVFVGIGIDITERKRIENALGESEEMYRALIDGLPDIVMRFDRAGRHLFVSDNVREVVDISPARFIGKTHRELGFPEALCQFWEESIQGVFESGALSESEFTFDGKDGRVTHNWRCVPERDEQGAVRSVLSVSRDITKHRKAERDYQTLFREMLDGFAVHEIICNDQGRPIDYRFLAVNPAFEKLTGLQARNIVGKTVREVLPNIDPHWFQTYGRVALTGEPAFFEYPALDLGKYFRVTAFRPASGQFACIFADITEQKHVEELARAKEKRAGLQRAAISQLAGDETLVNMDLPSALDHVTRVLANTIGVARSSVWQLSDDHSELRCLSLYEADKPMHSRGGVLDTSTFPAYFEALMAENRIYAEDAQNDPRSHELTDDYLAPLGISSMLDVAVRVEGRLFGVVSCEHVGPKRKWHFDEESFASVIAALVGQLFVGAERKRAVEALRDSEQRFRSVFENAPYAITISRRSGEYIDVNPAFLQSTGLARNVALGMKATDFLTYLFADDEQARQFLRATEGEAMRNLSLDVRTPDGNARSIVFSTAPINLSGAPCILSIVVDVTDLKQAEEEREKLREQLHQAQKMESAGRLAGGVAHDFNNMLGVILGHTELALESMDPAQPLFSDLQEIRKAAERSAELTRQLLAFARKQIAIPKVLSINETVEGMLNMLRRLIGENIDLAWLPGKNAGLIKMDPSQIDQILTNLCVNARDAIADTGRVTIETSDVLLDESCCPEQPGFVPGEYVRLAVSDDGCGMDKEVRENMFEPFFTTKEKGKGTGLGMATVYGIVKQNNGLINVYSEPGQGTTFKIYLPRHTGDAEPIKEKTSPGPDGRGDETILVTEDEPGILKTVTTILDRQGYTVLAASTPSEAIRMAREHAGDIQLLITDVVMPEMNGRDLVTNLSALHPELRCLFMSGYTADVIAHHNVLDESVQFIQKPFSSKHLLAKVRETLENS